MDSDARLGELENRIAIRDEITNAKLTKLTKGRDEDGEGNLENRNTALSIRLQELRQEEFIIDAAKPHEEAQLRKKNRFAPKFREIGNSGVERNPVNEAKREEDQLIAMAMELI